MKSTRGNVTKDVKYWNGQPWNKALTPKMKEFEKETGKHAVYRNKVTGGFEYWLYWRSSKQKNKKIVKSTIKETKVKRKTKTRQQKGKKKMTGKYICPFCYKTDSKTLILKHMDRCITKKKILKKNIKCTTEFSKDQIPTKTINTIVFKYYCSVNNRNTATYITNILNKEGYYTIRGKVSNTYRYRIWKTEAPLRNFHKSIDINIVEKKGLVSIQVKGFCKDHVNLAKEVTKHPNLYRNKYNHQVYYPLQPLIDKEYFKAMKTANIHVVDDTIIYTFKK